MSDAVEKFCELLAAWPDKERREVASIACLGIGCEFVQTGVSFDEHTPYGEMYVFPGRHELKAKMELLVNDHQLREEMLIPGLYHYLTSHFQNAATGSSETIDWHLRRIREFEEEIRKPRMERENQLSDDDINGFIAGLKEHLAAIPENCRNAGEIADRLEKEWAEIFTEQYWRELRLMKLRDSGYEPR